MDKYSELLSGLSKSKRSSGIDITLLSDSTAPCVVSDYISTGCLALDSILGGGVAVGRITEIIGDNSTGKTLIASQMVAAAQKRDILVSYIDTETAIVISKMQSLGIDTSKLLYANPDTVEDTFSYLDELVDLKQAKFPDDTLLVIWDSVAATSNITEMEQDYGKAGMGRGAQLISQALRKFSHRLAKAKICAVFLNQEKERVGVMFGDKVATYGGRAIPFHASTRIQLLLKQKIKNGKEVVGIESKAYILKNRLYRPYLYTILPIRWETGIDDAEASFMFMKEAGLLLQTGAFFTVKDIGPERYRKDKWAEFYEKNYTNIKDMIMNTRISEPEEDNDADETEN